jgi:hypothetical protein
VFENSALAGNTNVPPPATTHPLVDDGNTDRANTNDYDWLELFSFLSVVGQQKSSKQKL